MSAFATAVGSLPFEVLGWTLLHFLWQGALVALGLGVALRALRGRSSQARYLTSCLALVVMVAAPAITFAMLWQVDTLHRHGPSETAATAAASLRGHAVHREPVPPPPLTWSETLAPWAVYAWAAGVLLLQLRMARNLIRSRRLVVEETEAVAPFVAMRARALCQQLGVHRRVRVLMSHRVRAPLAIGWLRPVVLLPAAALTGMHPDHLRAILAHELAHIRRHDYLVNFLQVVVESLLFYHPGVWWVSRRIREEREHCCDDLAVLACGDALTYARALTELERSRIGAPQPALAANGGKLMDRIVRLVNSDTTCTRRGRALDGWVLPGFLALAAVLMFPIAAQAQQARQECPNCGGSGKVGGDQEVQVEARVIVRDAEGRLLSGSTLDLGELNVTVDLEDVRVDLADVIVGNLATDLEDVTLQLQGLGGQGLDFTLGVDAKALRSGDFAVQGIDPIAIDFAEIECDTAVDLTLLNDFVTFEADECEGQAAWITFGEMGDDGALLVTPQGVRTEIDGTFSFDSKAFAQDPNANVFTWAAPEAEENQVYVWYGTQEQVEAGEGEAHLFTFDTQIGRNVPQVLTWNADVAECEDEDEEECEDENAEYLFWATDGGGGTWVTPGGGENAGVWIQSGSGGTFVPSGKVQKNTATWFGEWDENEAEKDRDDDGCGNCHHCCCCHNSHGHGSVGHSSPSRHGNVLFDTRITDFEVHEPHAEIDVTIGADGHFRAKDMQPGRYQLRFDPAGNVEVEQLFDDAVQQILIHSITDNGRMVEQIFEVAPDNAQCVEQNVVQDLLLTDIEFGASESQKGDTTVHKYIYEVIGDDGTRAIIEAVGEAEPSQQELDELFRELIEVQVKEQPKDKVKLKSKTKTKSKGESSPVITF